jgi:hypothetical protein
MGKWYRGEEYRRVSGVAVASPGEEAGIWCLECINPKKTTPQYPEALHYCPKDSNFQLFKWPIFQAGRPPSGKRPRDYTRQYAA